MNLELKMKLVEIAQNKLIGNDNAHDFSHALRVLGLAESIADREGGDFDVIIPAALFHDLVVFPKNTQETSLSAPQSADFACSILSNIEDYPKNKMKAVHAAISTCSYSSLDDPTDLEGQIVQDADLLDSAGAIGMMRSFYYAGLLESKLYEPNDPMCENRIPSSKEFAMDFVTSRAMSLEERFYTITAQRMYMSRVRCMEMFKEHLKMEIEQSEILLTDQFEIDRHTSISNDIDQEFPSHRGVYLDLER